MRFLCAALLICLMLTGCTGVTVAYDPKSTGENDSPQLIAEEGGSDALKTGLYISTDISGSRSASEEDLGLASYEINLIAVNVDDDGVIQNCVIDGVSFSVSFDGEGRIISDTSGEVLSKNELGEGYGMKKYAHSRYEWNEQAAALADYAVGKTVAQLRAGAVNENGYAKDADLASSATIYIGTYVDGIERAVANARHLGARMGDELKLASIQNLSSSASVAKEGGVAQLDSDVTAITMRDAQISSCIIDSIQIAINFDGRGAITSDLSATLKTKNELGEDYGMKKYAHSRYEWNEQAAAFAAYVTGKTNEQVQNISVDARRAPGKVDLSSSVTISIGNFQNLIAKAAEQ